MTQTSTAAAFRLDSGRRLRFSIEWLEHGLALTIEGQTVECPDGDAVLAKIGEVIGPLNDPEAEDIRSLVSHQLTCLSYFNSPEEQR